MKLIRTAENATYHVHNHHRQHAEGKSENVEEWEGHESFFWIQNVCRITQYIGGKGYLKKTHKFRFIVELREEAAVCHQKEQRFLA